MDKYEFNIKIEQIKKLTGKGDYETAMKIADTIDWRRVRSTSLLTMVSQVYERNEEYQDAKDILLLAFERAPIGKGLLFKLTDLALREGNVQEAEAYYREFCDLAGDDPRQNLLRFLILEAKGAPIEQQINSLERYCQEELDEKWMYHLAELYQQAGREDDCVRICDKIMLLFGLGKYVDKAMELKLQYAPLTKYQMDLVENREKYEEKLRAVEEEYKKGVYRHVPEEEYYDSDDAEDEISGVEAGMPDMKPVGEDAAADGVADAAEAAEATEATDAAWKAARETAAARVSVSDEELEASLHEAKAEEELAKEMSQLEPYDEEQTAPAEETRIFRNVRELHEQREAKRQEALKAAEMQQAAVSVEDDELEEEEDALVEDWDLEPEEENRNHLMIEAEDPERGLALALESLKKLHREQGVKKPVAKISGDKLSRKGILAVAERLAGKDLVVEWAADLSSESVFELTQLMERDETDMVVVLIDTPERMERMHSSYPALAGKFQYIGCEGEAADAFAAEEARRQAALAEEEARRQAELAEEEARRQAELEEEERRQEEARLQLEAEREAEAARKRLADREEEIRRQAARDAEEKRRLQAIREAEEERRLQQIWDAEEARRLQAIREEEARRQAELAAEEQRRQEEEARYQAELAAEEARRQAEYEAESAARYQAEFAAEEARRQAEYEEEMRRRQEEEDARRQLRYEEDGEFSEEEEDGGYDEEERQEDGSQMDVEEFVQYACKYASEIDCSISGKSMLALYERAEMMEEDGESLTRISAEDLIEEAADKAEKKSFGGLFSSKYDKDGLLILKEKHFFD